MSTKATEAEKMKAGFLSAEKSLKAKKDAINELNVFPVPDGDTGTNMTLTLVSAEEALSELSDPDVEDICKAISSGSLRGARGNSGVILSQLLRGFTRELQNADTIDISVIALAMSRAADTAYKAVMKPKEGTILTVARWMAERAIELASETDDAAAFCRGVVEAGEEALFQTTQMLPELRQAGVIDAGGRGLMEVVKGAMRGVLGSDDPEEEQVFDDEAEIPAPAGTYSQAPADIKYGYCTEFLITPEDPFGDDEEKGLREYLSSIGDCVVVIADDDIVKVHVHTNEPGTAIQKGLSYGPLSNMKIDNMREQHQERLIKNAEELAARQVAEAEEKCEPAKSAGFISVASGEGIEEIFREIGVDKIIEGGQTMNPSTEEILTAVASVNATTVFILTNNSNIVLAAEQAAYLTEDKKVIVIPSDSIPQGIAAMIHYTPELTDEENRENMIAEMSEIRSGEVTYAIRSTVVDGIDIREGDYLGLGDHGLLATGPDLSDVTTDTVKGLIDEDTELISIYYGADTSDKEAETVSERIGAACPDCEVELHYGGQPVYYYILSAE